MRNESKRYNHEDPRQEARVSLGLLWCILFSLLGYGGTYHSVRFGNLYRWKQRIQSPSLEICAFFW